MDKPKFKISDKVTSVINPNFLGQIVSITQREGYYLYGLTYFKEDEPLTTSMYGFEIESVDNNGSIGFKKEGRKLCENLKY